jgi:chromosome segregation ATPase
LSKPGIPRKIINIYTDHLAKQEAEIEGLNNLLIDYRSNFGPIDLSSSAEFQKAKLEREIQEIRKKNNDYQLQVRTFQSQLTIKQNTIKDMDRALKELIEEISETKNPEITASEERVNKLEVLNEKLDKAISDLEETLSSLLQQFRRRES